MIQSRDRTDRPRPAVILASASPRRAALLRTIGIDFEVVPASIDEEAVVADAPDALAVRRAEAKVHWVGRRVDGGLIIGADTVVVVDGAILGKPNDANDARAMLHSLSGRSHTVITACVILHVPEGREQSLHEVTTVTLRRLSDQTIHRYVATGEPMDKAGAYAIQGKGACLVSRIDGCYFNVVGLPVAALVEGLEAFGLDVTDGWRRPETTDGGL